MVRFAGSVPGSELVDKSGFMSRRRDPPAHAAGVHTSSFLRALDGDRRYPTRAPVGRGPGQFSRWNARQPVGGRQTGVTAVRRASRPSAIRASRPCGPRCRSEDRRSLFPKWWRRRESNPRPKAFCNDVYMHIRVVGGNPRPKAPFPLSVPHRINPANRGSEPIPCAHRRLGKTAGKARLGRRPFPPGRRGQEERGYLSSQCQFSVGFCFVSTVCERWTPDMQSLRHVPSSNPVRPPSSRD